MTNEEILNKRWKNIDKYLLSYLKKYKEVNRDTKDKIQDIFNSMDITYQEINKLISKIQRNKLRKYIKELQKKGLLIDYFGYKARLLLNKKNITYAEWLEIMIQSVYIEENNELKEINNKLFYDVCEDSYNQALSEMKNRKSKLFDLSIYYTILNIPILTLTIDQYIKLIALDNSEEMYKRTLINLQLQKELNVDSPFYSELFKKQNNKIISTNNGKLSGGIVNVVENLSNTAYLQAGIENNVEQCRFIAEMDNKTTRMCNTLNNQIFSLSQMNVYQRYSALDKRIVTYHTLGLIQGENLPPINNHFHWCRSTITYLIQYEETDIARMKEKVNAI